MQVLPCSRLLRWTIQVFCTYMYELFFCNFFTLFVPSAAKVGTLRNNDGNGNGRKAIGLVSNDYDVKWPNFKFFWGWERQGDKFYHLCLNLGMAPLFSSNINSLLLSIWATWDNREMLWKDAEYIFQGCFHRRCRCGIVRSLIAK